MPHRRPHFFIVGAPKCGTTAMYEYLRQHPDLYLPERKELRYFGRDLEIRDRRRLTEAEYLRFFEPAPANSCIGSAYVWYLFSHSAADEIASFSPDARIIAMLRNPVQMIPALHAEHLTNGNENISSLEAALDAEPERRAGRRIPPHAHLPQGLLYSEVPRYSQQLKRYFQRFGRERVHVIIFDDFAASPDIAFAETLRFIEVRDDFRPSGFQVVNARKRLRSERLRHFLARPPESARRAIHHLVPRIVRRSMYERAKRFNTVVVERSTPDAAIERRLAEMFRAEVEDLSRLLERDLTHWTARKEVLPA